MSVDPSVALSVGARAVTTVQKKRRSAARHRRRRGDLVYLLMSLPALVVLFVFCYLPMGGLVMAFQNYRPVDGILHSAWVGMSNFSYLFVTNDAWRITRNTVGMNLIFIVVNTVLALTLAILMNEVRDKSKVLSKIYQSSFFLPYVLSYVAIAAFALAFLDTSSGVVNHVLAAVGLPTVNWYSSASWWPLILTLVEAWKRIGFWVIVYLASIMGSNPELYEAASIDGASRWQQVRAITLPLLKPLIVINVLLSVAHIFNADFGLFFQVTQNSTPLYPTTDVIDTYVYRSLTSLGNVGMAAAAGLYQSVVGFILVLGGNWLARRRASEGALF